MLVDLSPTDLIVISRALSHLPPSEAEPVLRRLSGLAPRRPVIDRTPDVLDHHRPAVR